MNNGKRFVIVTTKHRGVLAGYAEGDTTGDQVVLTKARMAIYWGTTRGIYQFSETGPTSTSRLGAVAPRIELRDITAVCDVTPEEEAAWNRSV